MFGGAQGITPIDLNRIHFSQSWYFDKNKKNISIPNTSTADYYLPVIKVLTPGISRS
jgi:hypothetical protein